MTRGAHLKYEINLPSDKLSQTQRHTFEDYQMKWPFPHISHLQKLKSSSREQHTLSANLCGMAAFHCEKSIRDWMCVGFLNFMFNVI